MALNNAINAPTPISMLNGGTGAALTAANGAIPYSGASTMALLANPAATGRVLQSGNAAAPTWTTSTFASTYTASNLLYSNGANNVVGLATANNSILTTNGSGVPSLATFNTVKNNLVTSAFAARVSVDILNTTGNGAAYDIVFDTAINNTGSNFNTSTGIYTAPVTGFYFFATTVFVSNLDVGMTNADWKIATSTNYEIYRGNLSESVGLTIFSITGSCIAYLTAADTVFVRIVIAGGAGNTATVTNDSRFGGYFIG